MKISSGNISKMVRGQPPRPAPLGSTKPVLRYFQWNTLKTNASLARVLRPQESGGMATSGFLDFGNRVSASNLNSKINLKIFSLPDLQTNLVQNLNCCSKGRRTML
jgi:hypothetical protein